MENKKLLELKIELLELKIKLIESNKKPDNNKHTNSDERIYNVRQSSKITGLSKRAIQHKCQKDNMAKINNKYLITDEVLLNWKNNKPNNNLKESNNFYQQSKTYLMKDNITNLYKIGRSNNPQIREKTLQSEKPNIKMVKVWNYDIESKLHNLYSDFRVRGEWFNLNKIQLRYICTHF